MEPDERWERQDEDMRSMVARVQLLVKEVASHDVALQRIEGNVNLLCVRVPVSMPADFARLEVRLTRACTDLEEIRVLLEQKFVLKTEFDPVKRGFYISVWTVITSLLGGAIALLFKGR